MKTVKKENSRGTWMIRIGMLLRNPKVALPVLALLVAGLILLPKVVSLYVLRNLIMIGFYMMLGLSLNFVSGYIGEVSLGHAAFYAVGAFTVSLLTVDGGWGFWPSVMAGVLLCGLLGALLAYATMRVSGTYLTVLTLAFFYLVMNIIQNWESVTHGAAGIFNIPAANIFGIKFTMQNAGYYYCLLAYTALAIVVTRLIINSRFGRAMKAVREDAMASTLIGINNQTYRVIAYVLSGMFAGLAGTLYGPFLGYINYLSFTYNMCLLSLVVLIIGGRGTIKGAIIGAIIIAPLGEVLRMAFTLFEYLPVQVMPDPEKWRFVLYGLLLVIMMRQRPQGILGGKSRLAYQMPKGIERKGDK